jgi:hypothetical protein
MLKHAQTHVDRLNVCMLCCELRAASHTFVYSYRDQLETNLMKLQVFLCTVMQGEVTTAL